MLSLIIIIIGAVLTMHTLEWCYPKIETAPSVEPVSKADMKDQLPLDGIDHDDLLDTYIKAAREIAEGHTKRQLITATWNLYMSSFPAEILLPFPPAQSVVHVKYYDTGGVQRTLTVDTDYQIDMKSEPGRIKPAFNMSWPATRTGNYDAVEVQFKAGYGDAATAVPANTKQAIKIHVADMFRFRETGAPMPAEAERLLNLETAEWFA